MTSSDHSASDDHTHDGGTHGMTTATAEPVEAKGDENAALQIICLGGGGGPSEDNVSGFLVRSLSSGWSRGSILAVDAGSHLAAITRVLEKSFPLYSTGNSDAATSTSPSGQLEPRKDRKPSTILPDGPFAGVRFPHQSARANALHLMHTYVSTYLITHPHLDHLSGFAINTAAFHGRSRPKTLAALPNTVDAVKRHIFNDVIWPNLSDEDGGVGFVTFQRLKEGGDPMIGEGDGRGYIDVCDGLGVKAFSVSHGLCTKTTAAHSHRGSISNGADLAAALHSASLPDGNAMPAGSRTVSNHEHSSVPGTPGPNRRQSLHNILQAGYPSQPCVVDSTAYFLRDEETCREVLVFGDVEPDSISLSPRNEFVWAEAARKVANGTLRGILIECSYTDAAMDEALFGHLCPRHVIAELQVLGHLVHEVKTGSQHSGAVKKRKRSGVSSMDSVASTPNDEIRKRGRHGLGASDTDFGRSQFDVAHPPRSESEALSPRAGAVRHVSVVPATFLPAQGHQSKRSSVSQMDWDEPPLQGIKVVIVHIKDTFKDGPPVSETIAAQLEAHEEHARDQGQALGCKFVISKSGESYWF